MDKNSLVLAYMGDAIYEVYIRRYLIQKGISKVNDLQKEAIFYVSAKGQEKYLKQMLDEDFLSQKEKDVVYRARNHKGSRHPKNTELMTYKYATGLEALIGYLFFEKNEKRIEEIMSFIIGE